MSYNTRFPGQEGELLSFVCRFLEEKGALGEPGENRVDMLLPSDLASALDLEEYISIVPGSADEQKEEKVGGRKSYPVHFGAPILDKICSITGSNPPLTQLSLSFNYLKKGGYDALIVNQFDFYKAKGTVAGDAQIKTHYAILTFKYLAQSDEQKEGLMDLAVNMETGAVVTGMVDRLSAVGKNYESHIVLDYSREKIDRLLKLTRLYVAQGVEETLSDYKKSMARRFKRDVQRLREYYDALGKEMEDSLSRSGVSPRLQEERRAKIAMIPDELAAKEQDILNKYSIRIKVSLAAVMAISTPAVKVFFNAVSGRQKKEISFIYNPVTKLMDPLVCATCGQSMYRVAFSERLELVCSRLVCEEK